MRHPQVSTALPSISASFDAGRSSSWVASAYLLTSTAFQPIWGRLSDIWGRKVAVLSCVVLFIIGSLACALAQTMTQLIVFRGLQGAGGGGLLTMVLIVGAGGGEGGVALIPWQVLIKFLIQL